jgi:transmembrane sensor
MSDTVPGKRLESAFAALRDEAEVQSLTREVLTRLNDELAQGDRPRRRRVLALSLVGATALTCTVAVLWVSRLSPVAGRAATESLPGFVASDATEDLRWRGLEEGGVEILSGAITLRLDATAVSVRAARGTSLRREQGSLRVLSGMAHVEVEPQRQGEVVRVLVSHGAVEVVGTRFTIEQGTDGGVVYLERGAVRFIADSGAVILMRPGDSLRYPIPESQPAAVTQSAPDDAIGTQREPVRPKAKPQPRGERATTTVAPKETTDVQLDPQALVRDIEAMRHRREYVELDALLTRTLAGGLAEPLREHASFDLCDLLVHHGNDHARACTHIAEHLRRYRGGDYTQTLERYQLEVGCER